MQKLPEYRRGNFSLLVTFHAEHILQLLYWHGHSSKATFKFKSFADRISYLHFGLLLSYHNGSNKNCNPS